MGGQNEESLGGKTKAQEIIAAGTNLSTENSTESAENKGVAPINSGIPVAKKYLEAMFAGHGDDEILHTDNFYEFKILRSLSRGRAFVGVSTVTGAEVENKRGKMIMSRAHADSVKTYAVFLDDIVRDFPPPDLKPSSIIETSAGCFQYSYFIEPTDVDTAKVFFKRLRKIKNLGDTGAMKTTQPMRIPMGVNGKTERKVDGVMVKTTDEERLFKVRLDEFNPELRYTLDELADAWGVNGGNLAADLAVLAHMQDKNPMPVEQILVSVALEALDYLDIQYDKKQIEPGKVHIECPLMHLHGVQTGSKQTTVFVNDDGSTGFFCQHEHKLNPGFNTTWAGKIKDALEDVETHAAGAELIDVAEGLKKGDNRGRDKLLARVAELGDYEIKEEIKSVICEDNKMMSKSAFNALYKKFDRRAKKNHPTEFVDGVDEMISRTVFLPTRNGDFFDTGNCKLYTGGAFDGKYKHLFPKVKDDPYPSPSKYFCGLEDKQEAEAMGWLPVEDKFITLRGDKCVNTYRPVTMLPIKGDVSGWYKVLEHVFGGHWGLVLDFLAFSVQYPLVKIRWQILGAGIPRTGKTLSIKPVSMIFESMTANIGPAEMKLGWGDIYQRNKFIFVEEVRDDTRAFFNGIKTKLANDSVDILNLKGGAIIYQKNLYAIIMFTNYLDALSFDGNDDKLMILETTDNFLTKAEYAAYGALCEEPEFLAACYYELLNRDVSGFCHGSLPFRSEAMLNMVELTRKDYLRWLDARIANREYPFNLPAFTFGALLGTFQPTFEAHFVGHGLVATTLKAAGFKSYAGLDRLHGRKRHTFWSDDPSFEGLPPVELYKRYLKVNKSATSEKVSF